MVLNKYQKLNLALANYLDSRFENAKLNVFHYFYLANPKHKKLDLYTKGTFGRFSNAFAFFLDAINNIYDSKRFDKYLNLAMKYVPLN